MMKIAIIREEKKHGTHVSSPDRFDIHILSETRLPSQAPREGTGYSVSRKSASSLYRRDNSSHLAKQRSFVPTLSSDKKTQQLKTGPHNPPVWFHGQCL